MAELLGGPVAQKICENIIDRLEKAKKSDKYPGRLPKLAIVRVGMPDLINRGYVYIAQPPLYGLKKKNSKSGKILKYLFNDEAKDALMEELGDDAEKYDMQRYKGLGEMDPEQLWETTMEPETRTLLQVSIEDAAAAELAVSELMGDQVEPRKEFIQKHARDVRFLDI